MNPLDVTHIEGKDLNALAGMAEDRPLREWWTSERQSVDCLNQLAVQDATLIALFLPVYIASDRSLNP